MTSTRSSWLGWPRRIRWGSSAACRGCSVSSKEQAERETKRNQHSCCQKEAVMENIRPIERYLQAVRLPPEMPSRMLCRSGRPQRETLSGYYRHRSFVGNDLFTDFS